MGSIIEGKGEFLKGIGGKLKRNVSERFNAINVIPNNVQSEANALVAGLTDMKPVKGLTNFGRLLGNGVFDFVDRQAEITRRWKEDLPSLGFVKK
jgi:hypothetical protein